MAKAGSVSQGCAGRPNQPANQLAQPESGFKNQPQATAATDVGTAVVKKNSVRKKLEPTNGRQINNAAIKPSSNSSGATTSVNFNVVKMLERNSGRDANSR